MKRVLYLFMAIFLLALNNGFSQEFRVVNGTIGLTDAAGTTLTTKIIKGSKVIVNYQPKSSEFALDSVLIDTSGAGYVVLNKANFGSSLTINSLQANHKIKIVYKQLQGSTISSERHYSKNGIDSMVRDSTPLVFSKTLALPITFESTTTDWASLITNFEGGVLTTAANPSATGINTSARVGKMVKGPGGQSWGGAYLTLTNPIDFTNKNTFNIQVYAPKVGTRITFKVENLTNGNVSYEKIDSTKTANAWETISFDFSGIDKNQTYQKIIIIFDLLDGSRIVGDGGPNSTYYFDNINLSYVAPPPPPAVPIALPLDFQLTDSLYKFTNFDGGHVTIVANSNPSGINKSSKVAKMIKGPGQPWGGSWIALTNPIDFTNKNRMVMQVYSPRVGAKVLLKVENLTNGGISFEASDSTTTANAWELLEFDYSTIDKTKSYQKVVVIFDNGTVGDSSANFTFYFDSINTGNVSSTPPPSTTIALPLDFQLPDSVYKFTNFGGGNDTVVANSNPSGINTSSKVSRMIKGPGGETWGGAWIALTNPIDFTNKNRMYMQVYSPRVGTKVLLKVENLTDGGTYFEASDSTTTANAWELLEFDYSLIDKTKSYQKIVVIFDNGTVGDGTANYTFYFDNISLGNVAPTTTLALPINFELPDSNYKFTDFNGGIATVVANPFSTGINTSAKVAKMTKGLGQDPQGWGGSYLTLTNPVPLNSKIFTIKVYADTGATIVFKLENGSNGSIFFQRDTMVTAATAKTWQTFTFNFNVAQPNSTVDSYQFGMGKYAVIDATQTYQKIVIIFDNGKVGDGSAKYTYYFDDIQQQ